MSENKMRTLYGKQPARSLLVDLSVPFTSWVGQDVCDALENLFSLTCNFNGPCRIPFFSIIILHDGIEVLLPYSYVKNNFPRIQTSVSAMRQLMNDKGNGSCTNYVSGIKEAVSQYQKQLNSSLQSGGICQQLEVVILTCQPQRVVQKQVEAALAALNVDSIKRLQVVCLDTGMYPGEAYCSQSSSGSMDDQSSPTSNLSNSGLLDISTIDTDLLCLQSFFNHWLLDTSADSEHLHLVLPPANHGPNLILKCDLQEKILHPAQLPYYSHFTFHADLSQMKMVFPSTSKALGVQLPIYQLHIVSLISRSAICDSNVFGMPMLLLPTRCWKIEWDDLEKNQQQLHALCQTLLHKDEVLIGRFQGPESQTCRAGTQPQPCSYFVLLPSETGSMLVKSLAIQELMLPSPGPCRVDTISEECKAAVEESLQQLERLDSYNPMLMPGQLYECLKNQNQKLPAHRSQKRPQTTVATSNRSVMSKVRKSQKQKQQLELCPHTDNADCLFETPLARRLESRSSGHTKRALYSCSSDRLLGEMDEEEETWSPTCTFPTTL